MFGKLNTCVNKKSYEIVLGFVPFCSFNFGNNTKDLKSDTYLLSFMKLCQMLQYKHKSGEF